MRSVPQLRLVRAVASLALAIAAPAIAQCHYSVELVSQLGCPIGSPSTLSATEIGNDATIVGIGSPCGTLKQIAFRWRSDIGLQFLPLGPGNGYSFARHVTDDGVIVGYMGTSSLGPLRGFVWKDGTVQTFSAPNPSHSVRAYCSTADGSVFGHIDASGNGLFPFWWRDGEYLDLGAAAGDQYSLRGATMDNIVAGRIYLPDGTTELPVRWQGGAFESVPLPPGYRRGGAERVNRSGTLVGALELPTPGQLLPHTFHGLVAVGSEATAVLPLAEFGHDAIMLNDINDLGQAVGRSFCSFNVPVCSARPVLWQDGKLIDLQPLIEDGFAGTPAVAVAINDRGQIVCSLFPGGAAPDILLTPIAPPADVNLDGRTDVKDLMLVLDNWGEVGVRTVLRSDVDESGAVDARDLATVLGGWTPVNDRR